ncbi:MAG: polyprenyl synthetase family protein [Planctomycetota bacterium]|jgi:octaprenyl-diphosphate synthase
MQSPLDTDTQASAAQVKVPAFRPIAEELSKVGNLIDQQLTSHVKAGDINGLLEQISLRSGKMIRPGLVLLAGRCYGKTTDKHITVAAVIEMIHNATLLHDDVIDEGKKRRGTPTINSLWGNESAVLLGDLILSHIFKMCAQLESRVSEVIATAAIRLCTGELRQVVQKHYWQLNEAEYIDVITEKSAVLFSSSCFLGALLAGASEPQAQSLADFGLNAGIAFQITDDLLDIVGDESKTGKTLGSDVDKHKLTLALIHLLKAVDEKEKNSIINSFLDRKDSQYDKRALVEILNRHGSLEYARSRAREFVATAKQALADLKESDFKEALIETAEFMTGRVS